MYLIGNNKTKQLFSFKESIIVSIADKMTTWEDYFSREKDAELNKELSTA